MPLKPVIFVPGFPASELKRRSTGTTLFPPALGVLFDDAKKRELVRLLVGPDDPPGEIFAGEPIRGVPFVAKQAESLYDILTSYDYLTSQANPSFAAIGWDWRQAVDEDRVLDDLEAAITERSDGGRQVVVLVHSTGGLVFRRLLETRPALAGRIEHVLAFGVPWVGALKAVRYLVRGEKFGFLNFSLSAGEVREVMRHAQAAYDLFPPDPARTDLAGVNLFVDDADPTQQIGPLVDLRWVPAGAENDFVRERAGDADRRLGGRTRSFDLPAGVAMPPVTNVAGWGGDTDTRCRMDAAGRVSFESTVQGDGTAAFASVTWLRGPGVRTFALPVGVYPTNGIPNRHARIWDAPPLLEIFDQVLRGAERRPFVCAAAGNEAMGRSRTVSVLLVAQDALGNPLPGARADFHGRLAGNSVEFHGAVRATFNLDREGIQGNVTATRFRFVVEVSWGARSADERREIPVIIPV